MSNIRAMNEVELPTNVNSDCRSPGFQISADRQEKNKELSVLKGILKYNERMKNYEKHIEEITELKNLIVGQKDEKIGDLNTRFKDQDEEIKKMKKILDIIKNENKKNTEK